MFAFLFSRVRRWLILTIVVPLVGLVARKAAMRIEAKHGKPTKVSKGLHQVGKLGQKRQGPPAR
ncbi:MAG: hypothetical protein ACT4QG_21235 [Sporichthyaceae bacterium]